MADVFSKEKRSWIMSRIKDKWTKAFKFISKYSCILITTFLYKLYMNYIVNFQNRVLSSVSDDTDKNLLIFLERRERLQNIETKFGKDAIIRIEKLAKAGLVVERLINNPSDIQRYFETTSLGRNALKHLLVITEKTK